jgi:hypothetical protein
LCNKIKKNKKYLWRKVLVTKSTSDEGSYDQKYLRYFYF